MKTPDLKPCPFCGETPCLKRIPLWRRSLNGTVHGYVGCYEYVVGCDNMQCGCSVRLMQNDTIYRSEEVAMQNAIDAWNRRADNV